MMWMSWILLVQFELTLARQAHNFEVSKAVAEAHACGQVCQSRLRHNNALDLAIVGKDFDYNFYATARNFSESRPGDALKLQVITGGNGTDSFKAGTTAYRFQYTSVDVDGRTPVPATAFIAFPYAPIPQGDGDSIPGSADPSESRQPARRDTKIKTDTSSGSGYARKDGGLPSSHHVYPLVAYAHGTIGLFHGCAPSMSPNMYDYDTWQPLISRGYAVVAPDYAGLGNNFTTHKYCSFAAHAADLYYAVVAARKLFGNRLSTRWLSAGHSQGGGAVWKLAESDFVRQDPAYLGSIAIAPATHLANKLLDDGGLSITTYLPNIPVALERFNPNYRPSMLAKPMQRRVELGKEAQLCISAFNGLSADLSRDEIVSDVGVQRDAPFLRHWQASQAPALGALSKAPILVIQGLADTTVLMKTTEEAVARSCASGNEVHLSLYPRMEHSPVLQAAASEWLGWVDWRFHGGHLASRNCSKRVRMPMDLEHVHAPPEDS